MSILFKANTICRHLAKPTDDQITARALSVVDGMMGDRNSELPERVTCIK